MKPLVGELIAAFAFRLQINHGPSSAGLHNQSQGAHRAVKLKSHALRQDLLAEQHFQQPLALARMGLTPLGAGREMQL